MPFLPFKLRKPARRPGAVDPAPIFTAPPTISGNPGAGQTLTATTGTVTGGVIVSSQWYRDGVATGVFTNTYVQSGADDIQFMDYRQTAASLGGTTAVAISNGIFSETYSTLLGPYDFASPNGTLLSAIGWTVDGGASGEWTKFTVQSGKAQVANAQRSGSPQETPIAHRNTTKTSQAIQADVSANAWKLILARLDASNFVLAKANGPDGIGIDQVINGTITAIVANVGPATGIGGAGTVRFVNDQGKLKVFQNGVQRGTEYNLPAALATATRAGFTDTSDTATYDNVIIEGLITPEFTITSVVGANTLNGVEFTISGTYTGAAPANFDVQFESQSGAVLHAFAAASSTIIAGGLWTIKASQLPSAAVISNTYTRIRMRKTGTVTPVRGATYLVPDYPAISPFKLGVNETSLGLWDIGSKGKWVDTISFNNRIRRRGEQPITGEYLSSADGLGGTVKRDWDGRIYGNSLGLTSYILAYDLTLSASEAGAYTINLGAGTVVTGATLGGASGWSYNSGTGVGTFTMISGQNTVNLTITVASIAVNGCLPVLRPTAAVGTFNTVALANTAAIAKSARYLDVKPANNDENFPDRTALAHPSRTPAQRVLQDGRRENIVAHCNNIGDLYWHVNMFDSDALIADDFTYIAANLAGSALCYVEWSNEFFNVIFKQCHDVRLMGVRRGFAPSGLANPAAAVPETVIDCQYPDILVNGSGVTQVAFNAGDKIFWNGFSGWRVYQAIGAQAAGSQLPTGASNANWTVVYDNSDTDRAGKRMVSTRMKEIRAIADPIFAAAGRARPRYIAGGIAAGGFAYVQPILDWDTGWLTFDRVCAAHYWGGGVAGLEMGAYNDNTVVNFTRADKEALYTTASRATALANAKAKFFSATRAVIDATVALIPIFRQQLADYCKSKGLSKNAIKLIQYEFHWHVVFGNLQGSKRWPDEAAAWNSGTAYSVDNLVKSGGEIFKCIVAHTNQATSNATYWTKIATAAIAAESPNRMTQLYFDIYLDPQFGADTTYMLDKFQSIAGEEAFFYQRLGGLTQNGTWGAMKTEADNDVSGGGSTNWLYKALKDKQAAL